MEYMISANIIPYSFGLGVFFRCSKTKVRSSCRLLPSQGAEKLQAIVALEKQMFQSLHFSITQNTVRTALYSPTLKPIHCKQSLMKQQPSDEESSWCCPIIANHPFPSNSSKISLKKVIHVFNAKLTMLQDVVPTTTLLNKVLSGFELSSKSYSWY